MIDLFGIVLIILSIIQFVKISINSSRPKIDATIVSIGKQVVVPINKGNKLKQSEVAYAHNGKNFKSDLLLKDKNKQIGEIIQITYKETDKDIIDTPLKIEMYYPKHDLKVAFVLLGIGLSIISISIFIIKYFNLW